MRNYPNTNNDNEINDKILQNIEYELDEYYTDQENHKDADIDKIRFQYNDYMINHQSKKILLKHIDDTIYMFDTIKINSFKQMDKKTLMIELGKLSKRIVTIVSDKDIDKVLKHIPEFNNMFSSCQNTKEDLIYCKQRKLIITKKNLIQLIEILASDILNPFKGNWIFNTVFTDNIIKFLKFIRRENETVFIQS
jgi:hypothetical protein